MSTGFVARSLTVGVAHAPGQLDLRYVADDRPAHAIQVPLADVAPPALDLLLAAASVYLGSICLAEDVFVDHVLPSGLLEDFSEIAEMLYDIRRWRDNLPLGGPPTLRAAGSYPGKPLAGELDDRRSVVLWSGGKDSTLALVTLHANGYTTHPLHATINAGAEAPELRAVRELAPLLGLAVVDELGVQHRDFLEFTAMYSAEWDSFPRNNCVPFGRDLLLAALAVPIAVRTGAACISMGHDHECRNAQVFYEGKRIPRNDLESSRAATIFELLMRRHVHPGLRLLPPVATVPELRILRDMLLNHPKLMARTSFCFWGDNCGRCGKCLRYFLADRVYGTSLLHFKANPLAPGACPELQDLLDDPTALFQKEVLLLLSRLAQRGDIRPGEDELARFATTYLPAFEHQLDAWEAELLTEYPDPQVPLEFRPASAASAARVVPADASEDSAPPQ